MNKRNRDRWVFVLAALLLKQISMIVMLDTMFQHILALLRDVGYDAPTSWHGSVCLVVHALYLIKESPSSYLADQATRIFVQNQLWFYS
jgi:hypothetical protein